MTKPTLTERLCADYNEPITLDNRDIATKEVEEYIAKRDEKK